MSTRFPSHLRCLMMLWLVIFGFLLNSTQTMRAHYLNPHTGRFWTMDSFEGNSSDPASLHKYLYCQNDPIINTDLSGHDVGEMVQIGSIMSTIANSPRTSQDAKHVWMKKTTNPPRLLTQGEINLASIIYGNTINFLKSGVSYDKWFIFQPFGREMTPRGIIYTGGETVTDYSVPNTSIMPSFAVQESTFIHEMCHVWQYQHGINVITGGLYRNYAWYGPNFGKIAFTDYGIEQQAQMTEDYYLLKYHNLRDTEFCPDPPPSLTLFEKVIPFL